VSRVHSDIEKYRHVRARAATSSDAAEVFDPESPTPVYIQLTNLLRVRLERGEWRTRQRFPSENELSQMYGIARMTARQVLSQLVNEGLLFRVQGKGTFVAESKIDTQSLSYVGIREQLEARGFAITTQVLEDAVVEPDARVARVLNLSPGEKVVRMRRMRLLDGEPISLHTSYVPQRLAPDLEWGDLETRQLCKILESDYGLRMTRVTEYLEAIAPALRDLKDLGASRTTPMMLLTQEVSDRVGAPFEFSQILVRGDKIRIEFHYNL
jgi:GntR family transcriptional regulator